MKVRKIVDVMTFSCSSQVLNRLLAEWFMYETYNISVGSGHFILTDEFNLIKVDLDNHVSYFSLHSRIFKDLTVSCSQP